MIWSTRPCFLSDSYQRHKICDFRETAILKILQNISVNIWSSHFLEKFKGNSNLNQPSKQYSRCLLDTNLYCQECEERKCYNEEELESLEILPSFDKKLIGTICDAMSRYQYFWYDKPQPAIFPTIFHFQLRTNICLIIWSVLPWTVIVTEI